MSPPARPVHAPPFLVRAYTWAAGIAAPLAYRRIARKLELQGVDPERFVERKGQATLPRPEGRLLWFHAASVGESLSVLRLIAHLGEGRPELSFLITSGTATSARILSRRLPPRCQHQFAALDSARYMRRFLDHWRPDAAIFVESELWPNMLRQTAHRGVPLALLNARISENSARNWKRFGHTARHIMGLFAMIHTQDRRTAAHLQGLGLTHAVAGQNLKAASGPLPCDAEELRRLKSVVADRPSWVASSTHAGEEEQVLAAHAALLERVPDLLLVLVPRHPERGDAVSALIDAQRLTQARRSSGGRPGPGVQVYLADTLGETGLWYALCPIVFLGGSLTAVGGHNPYEPAHAGAAILHGPLYANFSDTYAEFTARKAAVEVADSDALSTALHRLLTDPEALATQRRRATEFAAAQEDMLSVLSDELLAALSLK